MPEVENTEVVQTAQVSETLMGGFFVRDNQFLSSQQAAGNCTLREGNVKNFSLLF